VEIHAEVASAVLEYQAVGEEIRKQERRREELFTQIAAAAQDAECLTLAGRQVATFKEHTRTSVDLNRMREQVPLVVQEYETERRYRVLRASRR
jgi:predicted phage-related endonuclease